MMIINHGNVIIFNLPFANLDVTNWLDLNEIKSSHNTLSENINVINSNESKAFVVQCDTIKN